MAAKRKDDIRPRPVFRSHRMVEEDGQWYFYTREGTMEGPFGTKAAAKNQLEAYVRLLQSGLLPKISDLSLSSFEVKQTA